VGERIKQITWAPFEKLMVHEIGVHVTRAANAYSRGFNLAAAGWPGYEEGEEGLAIFCEKVWGRKAADAKTIDRDHYRYIIGTYASGVLDGSYHSPDESYALAVRLKTMNLLKQKIEKGRPIDMSQVEEKAREDTFEHVYRFYRGMPPGEVFIKDIVYHAGYVKMVKLFNNYDRSAKYVLDELLRGKYNPFIPLQVGVINGLYGHTN
jgi:hypothetical protein